MKTEFERLTVKFQREKVASLLAQCTSKQQEFFHKIYPKGVPVSSLANAYDLCARTIKKNEARPAPAGSESEGS